MTSLLTRIGVAGRFLAVAADDVVPIKGPDPPKAGCIARGDPIKRSCPGKTDRHTRHRRHQSFLLVPHPSVPKSPWYLQRRCSASPPWGDRGVAGNPHCRNSRWHRS